MNMFCYRKENHGYRVNLTYDSLVLIHTTLTTRMILF